MLVEAIVIYLGLHKALYVVSRDIKLIPAGVFSWGWFSIPMHCCIVVGEAKLNLICQQASRYCIFNQQGVNPGVPVSKQEYVEDTILVETLPF